MPVPERLRQIDVALLPRDASSEFHKLSCGSRVTNGVVQWSELSKPGDPLYRCSARHQRDFSSNTKPRMRRQFGRSFAYTREKALDLVALPHCAIGSVRVIVHCIPSHLAPPIKLFIVYIVTHVALYGRLRRVYVSTVL